jgi:glyoxylase-like metal-dependent hydrolase (beta-lactamase superfamily II)
MRIVKVFSVFALFLAANLSWADDHLKLQQAAEDVFAIVGELGNRSPENHGNNATFGLVVTRDGVVLIDSGGTYDGARAIDAVIRSVTDKPVVKVINTGGQDHRWLGNGYFRKQGAQIYASEAAVKDQKARVKDQFLALGTLVGDEAVKRTEAVYAETTFENAVAFKSGGTVFEIYHAGQAHTPGDSFVWLPQKSVMFTGDIVYVERMLGVMEYSNNKSWIGSYEAMAQFQPKYIVPGHGQPTDLAGAKKDTYDYLVYLRQAVADFMDDGGDMTNIGKIDQSAFSYLQNFDALAGRNAQQVYMEMEWE